MIAIDNYPVFESNQVLTSDQLNQMANYLDQQNRLTRAKLIGMGIVCGFELGFDTGNSNITISKGAGITSEGFLIHMPDCECTHFRPYELPPGSRYTPFEDPVTGEQDITLYEILSRPSSPVNPDEAALSAFTDDARNLEDHVVLLFLEIFDQDLKSCLGRNCDEFGIDRMFTLRKLLISTDDLNNLLLTRSGNVEVLYEEKYDLPRLALPRPLFDPTQNHSTDFTAFSEHYANAFDTDNGSGTVMEQLFDALEETYNLYEPFLAPLYGFNSPFSTAAMNNLRTQWQNFYRGAGAPGSPLAGMQYFYDFISDMIRAYEEFRLAAFDLMQACCPDMDRFPRHLMLGDVNGAVTCRPSTSRHGYTQPPIYNQQGRLMKETVSLHKRLVLMLESFDLEAINNPETGEAAPPLHITPSYEKENSLSERTIPYYYDIDREPAIAGLGILERSWNYALTRQCPASPFALSYHNRGTGTGPVSDPLNFTHDRYPFLRVEGHIGQPQQTVMDSLQGLIEQFNLPLDLKAVRLDTSAADTEIDYNCGFHDLQEEYLFVREDILDYLTMVNDLFGYLYSTGRFPLGTSSMDLPMPDPEDLEGAIGRLREVIPPCIEDFDFDSFHDSYSQAYNLIIPVVLALSPWIQQFDPSADYEPVNTNEVMKHLVGIWHKVFDHLLYDRFYRLYYAFCRREFYLVRSRQHIFRDLIRQHPGAEHMAGAYKGGTFIVLYESEENPRVVGDFALPYRCCSESDCVPLCEDDDFGVSRPLRARPDFIILGDNGEFIIDLMSNDLTEGRENVVIDSVTDSQIGNTVSLAAGPHILYTVTTFYHTFDYFDYTIRDLDTGETASARVTVVMKGSSTAVSTGCYSTEIFLCWGNDHVVTALTSRGLSTTGTDVERANRLLDSVRSSGGFTRDEIVSSYLESISARNALLTCLEIPFDPENWTANTTLIENYQAEHCGGINRSGGCYSTEVLTCWGRDRVDIAIRNRSLPLGGSLDENVATLLESLRSTNGFTISEIRFNSLEDRTARIGLLSCLGIPHNPDDYQGMETLIRNYQEENCGPIQDTFEPPITTGSVAFDPTNITTNDARALLRSRGVRTSDNTTRAELNDMLARNAVLDEDELQALTKKSIDGIMRSKGVEVSSGMTKEQMLKALLEHERENNG